MDLHKDKSIPPAPRTDAPEDAKPASSAPVDGPTPSSQGTTAPAGSETVTASTPSTSLQELEKKVVDVLRTCYDPEIPVNIHELGLIYNVDVRPEGTVRIRMTLTSPMCPVAESLPPEVEAKVGDIPGVTSAKVEVVWDPPWTPAMMSEAAKLQLNMM